MFSTLWGLYAFQASFNSERDHEYPFNSSKKRSSVLITKTDGALRLYTKGASETSELVMSVADTNYCRGKMQSICVVAAIQLRFAATSITVRTGWRTPFRGQHRVQYDDNSVSHGKRCRLEEDISPSFTDLFRLPGQM